MWICRFAVDAKLCQNCGDVDPSNKKAIRSLTFKMSSISNIGNIFLMIVIVMAIGFLIYHYFGTEKWYMIFVVPIFIGIFVSIIETATGLKIVDGKYIFISDQDRLKFTEMIQQSLNGFIKANCKELSKHHNRDNEHFYIDILKLFVEKVIGSDRVGVMDISSIALCNWKSFIDAKVKNCKKG